MERLIARVRETRGRSDANTLVPLEKVFRFFKRELENHLRREEEVLFPLIAATRNSLEIRRRTAPVFVWSLGQSHRHHGRGP